MRPEHHERARVEAESVARRALFARLEPTRVDAVWEYPRLLPKARESQETEHPPSHHDHAPRSRSRPMRRQHFAPSPHALAPRAAPHTVQVAPRKRDDEGQRLP